MKILLANPPCQIDLGNGLERYFVRSGSRWPFSTTKKRSESLTYIPFPFYLAYAAALLKRADFDVQAFDGIALNLTTQEFLRKFSELAPDIILFETSTPTINHDLELIKKMKQLQPKTVIVLVGPHTTTFPEQVIRDNDSVDYVICQEYELAFLQLCQARRNKNANFTNIPGLVYRTSGKIMVNPPALIDPLDQLPFPDRDIFPTNDRPNLAIYWDGFCQYRPAIQMHASRGCPFRCNFCLWNQVIYRNGKYRTFSVDRIISEMILARDRYGAREIYFDDDTFTGNRQQVLSLCREIRRKKLGLKWSVMGDAMISDKSMIDAMADAGCIGMKFGVESGNSQILKHIQKPVKFDKLRQVAKWCAARQIKTHATFTFGLSGETLASMNQTINLAKSLDVDSVQFSITTPFPGTRYYDELKRTNRLQAKAWEDYDGSSSSIVRFENLDRATVVKVCQTASGRWLRHKMLEPRWLLRQLYNLNRLRQGQGWGALFQRAKRGWELIF